MKETEIYRNATFLGTVNIGDAFFLPTIDGTAGQVLSTDGDGVASWSNVAGLALSTDDLTEGSSNLFFTNERVDDRVNALMINSTSVTWTYDDNANTLKADVNLTPFSTDDLTEGSTNLYFSNEAIDDRVDALIQNGTGLDWVYDDNSNTLTGTVDLTPFDTDNLSEGSTNLYFTNSRHDDRTSVLIQNGTGISWVYNGGAGLLTPTVSLSPFSTTDLSEGTNLYFTDQRVDDRVSALMINSASVTWTYDSINNTLSATAASVIPAVSVKKNGVLSSTRGTLNFIPGTGITLNIADNGLDSSADITISSAISQNLATDNLVQDLEARTYNMNDQDLTFNNGAFKILDTGSDDILDFQHAGGQVTFGGVSGAGTGGSNWIHKNLQQTSAGAFSTTSTVWEHRDYAGNAGLKLTNWYTTGGINQYCTINYDGGLGSMYILNNGGGAIQLGTDSTINIGYGTGTNSPETLKLCAKAGEFVITGAAAGVGSTTFKDLSATKAGIEYDTDYSGTFSGLSLINKDFADVTYAPLSSSTSAGSGLTLSSGVINLGGALTLDADIEGTGPAGFNISLGLNTLNKNLNTFNINAKEKYEKYSSNPFPYSLGGSSLSHDEQGVIIDVNYTSGIDVRQEILSSNISNIITDTDPGSRISSKIYLNNTGCSASSLDIDNNTGTFLNIEKSLIGMASVTNNSYGSPVMKFEIDADNSTTKFTDDRTITKGIEYAADYRLGYTDRTLIDRKFADDTYAPISSAITDANKGDITVSGTGSSWTINAGAVSLNKIQTIGSERILGRYSTGTGTVQELTIGAGLSLSGTGTLSASSSSSSGQIRVIRDSDNGTPTYFSDLQTALETCKAANTEAVITLYDNITLTSGIRMEAGGSAGTTGKGYLYSSMLIDFNGFTVTYGGSSDSDPSIYFINNVSTSRTLNLTNGSLKRTAGGAPALAAQDGLANLIMSNMYIFSSVSHGVYIQMENSTDGFANFGNSVFESTGNSGLYINSYSAKSFTAIANSGSGLHCPYDTAVAIKLTDFTAINTGASAGSYAISVNGECDLSNFHAKSNAGPALSTGSQFQGSCSRFDLESDTGKGIHSISSSGVNYLPRFSNFTITCSDNNCIDSNIDNCSFSNFFIINDSASSTTISEVGGGSSGSFNNKYYNGTVINKNGPALEVTNSTGICFKGVSFTSVQNVPVTISLTAATHSVSFVKCNIESKLATALGHGVGITNTIGSVDIRNCDIEVANINAICIKGSSSGQSITMRNTDLKGSSLYLTDVTLNTVYTDIYGNTTT